MNKRKTLYILLLIFFFGALLRTFKLAEFPPALNWDEVSHGYNAYSVLKTGTDEWGKLPLFDFRAYGDYPTPLNLYLTIPFVFIGGLSTFAIRFPHAILGSLTIISTYFLALGITKKRGIALIASFLIAISAWSVFTSRFVLQANLSVFLLTTATALVLNKKNHKSFLPLSLVLFFLTLFSYHSTRIFSPLFLVLLAVVYRKDVFKKTTLALLAVFYIFAIGIFLNPESRARGRWVFLLNDAGIEKIIEKRNTSTFPPLVKRLFYNRPTYFVTEFSKNYFDYFTPKFLFTNGGTHYQFSVPGHGLEYIVNLPFFYLGLFIVLKRFVMKKDNESIILLGWLILAPLPAAITTEKFAVVRSLILLPLPQILSAIGFYAMYEYLKKRTKYFNTVPVVYVIVLLISLAQYLKVYTLKYTIEYSWVWQYGYDEVVDYVGNHYQDYDKIVVSKKYGEPHEFFLFYLEYDPQVYKNDPNLIRFFQSDWYWVDRFDKFYFVNDWQIVGQKASDNYLFNLESGSLVDCSPEENKCLLITSPDNVPAGWDLKETINFLDGERAFELYEN